MEVYPIARVNTTKYYNRMDHIEEGIPTGVKGQPSLITPEEKLIVTKYIDDWNETVYDVVDYMNHLCLKRFGKDKNAR